MLALDDRRPALAGAQPFSPPRPVSGAPLAALRGHALGERFCAWRGVSGGACVFSIYRPRDCPAYEGAVLIVAGRDEAGEQRALSVEDTGCLPDLVIAAAAARWTAAPVEFHVHLLARAPAARRALIADLAGTVAGVGDAGYMARRS
jgi:hypothetical protein